jgi:hypothetical protein
LDDDNVQDINEHLGMVTYIMLGRVYDMLALIADGVGKGEDALRLMELHRSGELMSPPPSLTMGDDDEQSED